jgi:O-antigen/teichoic acid export membrane protein
MSPTPPVIPQGSLISPSLWICVGSVVNTVREWLKRLILANYPPEILGAYSVSAFGHKPRC